MKHLAACLLVAAGCFNPTYHDPACGPNGECPSGLSCYAGTCLAGPPDDARLDGEIDAPDGPPIDAARNCVGSGTWELCFTGAAPATIVALSGAINTDTSPSCATNVEWTSPSQPAACVIAGAGISISSTVTASGTKPLVLLSTGTITMTSGATLDVASHRVTATIGAAAQSASCATFLRDPAASTGGGGGGAAGSFMSGGGDGGAGGNGALPGLAANPDAAPPSILRGGCAGQKGGDAAANTGGAAGKGGGAVYLAARTSIALAGSINASGSSGLPGDTAAGGGGGGAGGMIVLWAPTITASSAKALANGGGGGGAGGSGLGQAGSDPTPSLPLSPAAGGQGGAGNGCGGNGKGGNGAASTTDAVSGQAGANLNNCGGGGGGGALGYIRSNVTITGLTASPLPSVVP